MNLENLQTTAFQDNDNLEKLLKLITEKYKEGKITGNDLEKITSTICQLSTKLTDNLNTPISDKKAKEMILAYRKEFDSEKIMNDIFRIDYKLISRLIENQQDLILKFAQLDIELNLLYQDENRNQRLIINQESSMELTKDAVDALRKNFYNPKKGLRSKLDASITKMFNDGEIHENTRQITIPYKSNFDQFDPEKYSGIVLIPAIDNKTEDKDKLHKITFVMYFEERISSPIEPTTYYDVFQLCPPGNCF